MVAKTDCACSPVTFMIEGPIGAYKEAGKIAELIKYCHLYFGSKKPLKSAKSSLAVKWRGKS